MQRSLFPLDYLEKFPKPTLYGSEERGAIFTRREVVDFILDLVGYTVNMPLDEFRLLEPSFGNGDFLVSIIDRLLKAYYSTHKNYNDIEIILNGSIRGVELHHETFIETRRKLLTLLQENGVPFNNANSLLDAWLIEGDFLLVDLPHLFTHTVGNPPYVRQELIPDKLLAAYRSRYSTIYDRADLYIPFIERSLSELEPCGVLGFICSDRWMKNKYGGPLRTLVSKKYNLSCYVDMVDTPAFHTDVIAYPAITIIRREKQGITRIVHRPKIDSDTLSILATSLNSLVIEKGGEIIEARDIVNRGDPWILQTNDQLSLVRRLENEFPLLEETGCKVGIGVATGADRVFIGPFESLDVERDRILPLVKTTDIDRGIIDWKGLGVINPFNDDGSLVDLGLYPKLHRHFQKFEAIIRNRNCAKNNPKSWFRTIDRIYPDLKNQAKLLIPDIKGDANIVLDEGNYYPHHNLYYITSKEWDLRALQAVLLSGIAKLFVSTYSIKMRGGYLRFQAQYLRRIRLPLWKDVASKIQNELIEAVNQGNVDACNNAVYKLYRLTTDERAAIGGNGNLEIS